MDISAFNQYEIHENELCTILENTGDDRPSRVKVHILNLMPLIPRDGKTVTSKINRKIFLNDDNCKPSISSSIKLQNFINIRAFKNVNTSHLEKGTRCICMPIMKGLKDIFLTDKILP